MTPGKLPHAKRLNVQKDERTSYDERGGGSEKDVSWRRCSRLMTTLYIRISPGCLLLSPFSILLTPLPGNVVSFHSTFLRLPSFHSPTSVRFRRWVPLGPLSVIAFLNSMLVALRGE